MHSFTKRDYYAPWTRFSITEMTGACITYKSLDSLEGSCLQFLRGIVVDGG